MFASLSRKFCVFKVELYYNFFNLKSRISIRKPPRELLLSSVTCVTKGWAREVAFLILFSVEVVKSFGACDSVLDRTS